MCGICGFVSSSGDSAGVVREMTAAIAHRGPDDVGFASGAGWALGMRRLSIIDIEGGAQPISTPDGRYTIVYNGEVFNYRELRAEMERAGERFSTQSDTEVVLRGFLKGGEGFLSRIEGMFAFLLHDAKERAVYAARDVFGIKPLYFALVGDGVVLASEIRCFKKVPGLRFRLDASSLAAYALCGYVPGEGTMFEGVRRVPPGRVLKFSTDGVVEMRHFDAALDPNELARAECDRRQAGRILCAAVERALISDVPVGLYLSGGVDSSVIAAIVARDLGKKLASFSVRFPEDPAFDEGAAAEHTAQTLGLDHESIAVSAGDFADLSSLALALEEPLADPSAVALRRLSRLAGSRLKVVLSGEGGDELFGGYHRYFWERWVDSYSRAPALLRGSVEAAGSAFVGGRLRRRLKKLSYSAHLPRHLRYASWFSPFRPEERAGLLLHARVGDPAEELCRAFSRSEALCGSARLQWVDLTTFLRDDLLMKADKMSMANGLEVRVPFLQTDVVRAAFGLSAGDRVCAKRTKPFLRDFLAGYIPGETSARRKKGFEIPLGRWYSGPLRDAWRVYLSDDAVRRRGIFDPAVVARILAEHDSGVADRATAIFSLALAEAWFGEWLD